MNKLREQAIKLRDNGYSYNMINNELGIAKSTLSNWFKDRPFTPNKKVIQRIQSGPIKSGARKHNERVTEIEHYKHWAQSYIGKLSEREIMMLGIGLYIGEGAKTIEQVRIINSDPKVIKLAIIWLERCFSVPPENLVIALHLYPDSNVQASKKFWSQITTIPLENFRTTQIDKRKDKSVRKRNSLPYGTAHVRVVALGDKEKGVRLFRKIDGLMLGVYNSLSK